MNSALAILGPLVLTPDLLLLLGCEVVDNVECLADLFGRLALDHVGNCLAAYVKQRLDVKVIGGLYDEPSAIGSLLLSGIRHRRT